MRVTVSAVDVTLLKCYCVDRGIGYKKEIVELIKCQGFLGLKQNLSRPSAEAFLSSSSWFRHIV